MPSAAYLRGVYPGIAGIEYKDRNGARAHRAQRGIAYRASTPPFRAVRPSARASRRRASL